MEHKTFISYKYSEAKDLRDEIIKKMGDAASYYQGETSDSPDLTDLKTETIKRRLKDMLYSTTVTIIIISPNMHESRWIDWEIAYSLKSITREDRTSHPNGLVGVIQKVNGGYGWFKEEKTNADGCVVTSYKDICLSPLIYLNRYNKKEPQFICDLCRTVDPLTGSYLSYVEEDEFLAHVSKYVNNAFDKCQNDASGYHLVKETNSPAPLP